MLRGVDFDVAPGTVFALLGSNGAGKTTVVKVLSTLLRADGGTAVVNGFNVLEQDAEVRASISLTGQFAAVDEAQERVRMGRGPKLIGGCDVESRRTPEART